MTVSGQFSCPPPGSFVAVSGQLLVSAVTGLDVPGKRVMGDPNQLRGITDTTRSNQMSTPIENSGGSDTKCFQRVHDLLDGLHGVHPGADALEQR
jgi:hypothetical protein